MRDLFLSEDEQQERKGVIIDAEKSIIIHDERIARILLFLNAIPQSRYGMVFALIHDLT